MSVLQLSVFAENKPGALIEMTRLLGEAGVNIRALSLADTADFGILRLIADDPEKAGRVLTDHGYVVRITPVICAEMPDEPGALAHILLTLERAGINIEYTYAFIARHAENAYVVLSVSDCRAAETTLAAAGVGLLTADAAKFGAS
ncbi:MAG: ACT domain-containing protein [Clostridia bacterium]|nr:ACT domain-containing protein [Clostridia bacterium]